ncbi:hypothetical protein [Nonomuraea wenchangensis]|uniref:hypothetical protein n=1 Tax=Nonomuraea wenchangensis TaxID=568860 RepID=UPI003318D037
MMILQGKGGRACGPPSWSGNSLAEPAYAFLKVFLRGQSPRRRIGGRRPPSARGPRTSRRRASGLLGWDVTEPPGRLHMALVARRLHGNELP